VKWLRERLLIILFPLIIFSACATKEALKSTSDDEILRERIMAYWNHKIKQEFEKSYEYEYPLFQKTISMVMYIKGFNTERAAWSGARIERIDVREENAAVDMKIMVNIAVSSSRNLEHEGFVKEKWVKVDGIWYHIPVKFREHQNAQ